MARQNRVNPFGELIATPDRGTLMGNRGVLHDAQGRIKRPWQLKRWLICVLEFRGRKRSVMRPGHYTELFFLDEATALAAGHRPCAECRRPRFVAFCNAWAKGNGMPKGSRLSATQIDDQLHAERIATDRCELSAQVALEELPNGVIITIPPEVQTSYLVCRDRLLAWSPAGYGDARPRSNHKKVRVLTPKSTVAAIRAAYVPDVHHSAAWDRASCACEISS
jgi:hypothetical protein